MRGPGAEGLPWDCKIYVYKNDTELPLNASDFAPCEIVRHQGAWMDHWRVFAPSDKPYVVQWLDSMQMDPNVNMKRIIATMAKNSLQLISPAYNGSGWDFMHQAALPRKENGIGHVTDFVEFQVSIFTRDSFRCLQSIIEETPTIHLGWGVDEIFPKLCGARVGIVDVMTQSKWRTEQLYDTEEAQREMNETLRKFPLEDPLETLMVETLVETLRKFPSLTTTTTTTSTAAQECVDGASSDVSSGGSMLKCSQVKSFCSHATHGSLIVSNCPVTCHKAKAGCLLPAATCEDGSTSGVSSGGRALTCSQVRPYCNHATFGSLIRGSCPKTCGACS
ncbi:unnamed protein product [Polarella glacialis]|uniref:ShKT domain-containing protein n=1 Tax=Polarella glacialis TaxID=89957 RepID=A0A813HRX8_POLGL|nr:unnamed protein product [Polarella glacialis]